MSVPWKIRLMLGVHTFITKASFRPNITANRRLLKLIDPKISPSPPSSSDITVDPTRNLWFRIYTPTAAVHGGDNFPVIVYYHGGGFATYAPDSAIFDALARRFSQELHSVVVSVNYRLAPEYRFPSQYDDGFDVVKFLDDVGPTHLPPGADLSRCFIVGDSAGGNLGHHVAVRASGYGFKRVRLLGLIALQPFFGGEERTGSEIRLASRTPVLTTNQTDWYWKAFLPIGSDRDHPAANVMGPNSVDVSGLKLPGCLLVVGGSDPLQDWQRKYCEWLRRSGKEVRLVEYPNAFHGFYAFSELPESSLLLDEIRDFMRLQLKVV